MLLFYFYLVSSFVAWSQGRVKIQEEAEHHEVAQHGVDPFGYASFGAVDLAVDRTHTNISARQTTCLSLRRTCARYAHAAFSVFHPSCCSSILLRLTRSFVAENIPRLTGLQQSFTSTRRRKFVQGPAVSSKSIPRTLAKTFQEK